VPHDGRQLHAETLKTRAVQEASQMKMRAQTYEAIAWGSVLVACEGAIFFPTLRIAAIITLITWGVVIVVRPPQKAAR
jgi:hypothetical protein